MLRKLKNIPRKKWILFAVAGFCTIVFLILMGIISARGKSLPDQLEAQRWDPEGGAAQVGVYFSVDAGAAPDTFQMLRYKLDQVLTDAGIEVAEENPSARLYADAYCATGTMELQNGKNHVTVDTLGVSGDFFYFHPLEYLSGYSFAGDEINQDYVIIDEHTAWQLFGGTNVAGMTITSGDKVLFVRGVYRETESRLAKAAGLDAPLVFVSYDTLTDYGVSYGINAYEIVMPNPIRDFAVTKVKEALGMDDPYVELIDATARFKVPHELSVLKNFGLRSMNAKAIIFPYWENMARSMEDYISVLLFMAGLFLIAAVVLFIYLIVSWWRHKGWGWQERVAKIWNRWMDKNYQRKVDRAAKKRLAKEKAIDTKDEKDS